jgi:hypothetical protein
MAFSWKIAAAINWKMCAISEAACCPHLGQPPNGAYQNSGVQNLNGLQVALMKSLACSCAHCQQNKARKRPSVQLDSVRSSRHCSPTTARIIHQTSVCVAQQNLLDMRLHTTLLPHLVGFGRKWCITLAKARRPWEGFWGLQLSWLVLPMSALTSQIVFHKQARPMHAMCSALLAGRRQDRTRVGFFRN